MTWRAFEEAAPRYEAWYRSARGRRTSYAERILLRRLLQHLPASETAIEIGCGTGHFTRWLATHGLEVLGLDRSWTMLAEARRMTPTLPLLQADAHELPLRDCCVDLSVFVTTLEFLECPYRALVEATRVARKGVILIVLNRWSAAGLSRRWGRDAGGTLLGHARDVSLPSLRALLRRTAGRRLQRIYWSSAVFPIPFHRITAPAPLGDVLGVAEILTRV